MKGRLPELDLRLPEVLTVMSMIYVLLMGDWPSAVVFVASLAGYISERVLCPKEDKQAEELARLKDRMGKLELRMGVRQ